MKAHVFYVLVGALALSLSTIAQAKPISRIIAEMGLSPADFEIVSATSNELLAAGTPSVGQQRGWINEDTGSNGNIRVQSVQDNCVVLQHVIQPDGTGNTREIRTRRCRTADGNWLLAP